MVPRRALAAALVLVACGGPPPAGPARAPDQAARAATPAPPASEHAAPAPPRDAQADADADKEQEAVRRVFAEYGAALGARDGAAAVALVDRASVLAYEAHRRDALSLGRRELATRGLLDKLVILRLRHELTRKELESATGETLLRLGVDRGWVGSRPPEVGRVVIEGDRARATVKGFDVFVFEFVREGGAWKLELGKLLAIGEKAIRQLYERDASGSSASASVSEEEWVLGLIGRVSATPVPRAILDGPRTK